MTLTIKSKTPSKVERKRETIEGKSFFFFFKNLFIYFNWRLITLQYCGGFLFLEHEVPYFYFALGFTDYVSGSVRRQDTHITWIYQSNVRGRFWEVLSLSKVTWQLKME